MYQRRLFPRKPGCTTSTRAHLRAAAHRVLDRAQAGDREAMPHITWALTITGDIPTVLDRRPNTTTKEIEP